MENYGVRYGVLYGTLSVLLTLGLYMSNSDMMFSSAIGFGSLGVLVVFMVLAAVHTRNKDLGGYATFEQVLRPAFITAVVGLLFGFIFQYVLYNFIDTGLNERLLEYSINTTESMLENFGMDEDLIEESIDTIEEQGVNTSLGGLLLNYFVVVIIGFIIAAIIAAITKRKMPPEMAFAETDEEA